MIILWNATQTTKQITTATQLVELYDNLRLCQCLVPVAFFVCWWFNLYTLFFSGSQSLPNFLLTIPILIYSNMSIPNTDPISLLFVSQIQNLFTLLYNASHKSLGNEGRQNTVSVVLICVSYF